MLSNQQSKQQPHAAALLPAILLGIERQRPKPKAPRLTTASPGAVGEVIRQWGEFGETGTAAGEEISVRSCIPDNIFATACFSSDFPTHHVPFSSDYELLDCLRYVVQPHSSISAVAMYNRLQLAAESVAPPHNAHDFRCHVLSMWKALSDAVTDANCWSFKDTGNMWGLSLIHI